MKKYLVYITTVLMVACDAGYEDEQATLTSPAINAVIDTEFTDLSAVYEQQLSDVQVLIEGEIIALLPDDNEGSRHQKFIVKLNSGQTVLIVHNIDLAPRVNSIKKGISVIVYGEYEYNEKGGLIHWTHHDPQNLHEHGWIEYEGLKYE